MALSGVWLDRCSGTQERCFLDVEARVDETWVVHAHKVRRPGGGRSLATIGRDWILLRREVITVQVLRRG